MDSFYPFIYEIERKEDEPQPLYIELYPPMERIQKEEKEDVQESTVIIIDLL